MENHVGFLLNKPPYPCHLFLNHNFFKIPILQELEYINSNNFKTKKFLKRCNLKIILKNHYFKCVLNNSICRVQGPASQKEDLKSASVLRFK